MIGKTLGKYRIVARLGQGGMAEVYKAYHAALERHVALKLIKTTVADDPEYRIRFEREAKSAAALRHPNIVQVYDFDIEPESGRPYIVMEFIEGDSLADELVRRAKNGTPLTLSDLASIISQVAGALAYAHQHGVIHRDVKLGNIMRDESGRMILTDFGLAKLVAGPSVTSSNLSLGTPDYMSPEQATGKAVDARTDLYSLGVILYKLLTGQMPYQADTPMATLFKHILEPVPDPRAIRPDVPEGLAHIVMKCMAKSPDERFQTAEELVADLQAVLVHVEPAFAQSPLPAILPTSVTPAKSGLSLSTRRMPGTFVVSLQFSRPPEPSLPAQVIGFVGREAELTYFAKQLEVRHLAVITGMPGVGKTALATELARRQDRPSHTFWHSFHEGEGVNALIWKLAGFLAWHDQVGLWNTLQACTHTGSPTPPPEVLLDYLFQMIRGRKFLLYFDDFHCVDDDPLLGQFIARLRPALQAGQVDVIIASQRRPTFVHEGDFRTLEGLTLAALRDLAILRGLDLADELVQELYANTEGNAQLVMLALDALRHTREPIHLISRLSESTQVELFLVKQVDQGLTDEERNVLGAVAILLGYPARRDAIVAVLDGSSVRRPLSDLTNRSLLTMKEKDNVKEYYLNAMLRAYYYDLFSQHERQAMHRRAGEFYENEPPDALNRLRAALHLQRCGEQARALRLVTTDAWPIINQGQARTLRQMLVQFTERQLDPLDWVKVLLACGQVYALLGETQKARESYEAALGQATTVTEAHSLQARACLGLGELLQDDAPQEALDWLRRGLNAAQASQAAEETALHIRTGGLLTYLGHHDQALIELQQGLELLPSMPSRLHITALGNLGNIFCTRGDIERGLAYYQEVLKIAQKLGDYWAMVEVWLNLGIELDFAGRWPEALAQFQQALEQAERLGSLRQQARSWLSIGVTCTKQGNDELAQQSLSKCIAAARSQDLRAYLIYADDSLAGLYLNLSQLEEAEACLAEAESLAQATGVQEQLPETYRHWALVRLAQQRPHEALTFAERSVGTAREFQSYHDEGSGLRVLGQAQWANGRIEEAGASFEASLSILTGRDPYETARTQVAWARCLRSQGNTDRSATLLQQARSAFLQLGAQRDLVDLATLEEAVQGASHS